MSSFETPLPYYKVANSNKSEVYGAFAQEVQKLVELQPQTPGFDDVKNSYILRKCLQALIVNIHDSATSSNSMQEHCHLFITLLHCFCSGQKAVTDPDTITTFALALLEVNPKRVPAFAFGYLRVLGTPIFIPALVRRTRGWNLLQRLLIQLLSFLGHLSAYQAEKEAFEVFNTAVLRLLLVIIHDFSAFLCDFCSTLVATLPNHCVQVRNLILSAYPSANKLPDPTKVDLRRAIDAQWVQTPKVVEDWSSRLFADGCFEALQTFYETGDEGKLSQVRQSLLLLPVSLAALGPEHEISRQTILAEGTKYDRGLIHALIMDLMMNADVELVTADWSVVKGTIPKNAAIKVILYLLDNLDREGQDVIIHELCDQLRYPNTHTILAARLLYWLCTVGAEARARRELVQRQLRTRTTVHRPHPWGIMTLDHLLRSSDATTSSTT